ncbi:polysaccharide deacetylase family protein [Lyngbya sp. CCY1209]|uniref:polysaccharide deacetylase family protein n=1 Tax=Lyngbya sp. CCY1209 TaxID=2886103 RepID=UPI002D217C5E|nr:polysaccharide deacetylase family protein [Lyngbya sp. CCY1209]MEB3886613.1 polysaccharide deacetylase family protein [Lyngbya sp. CCY1209]
MAKSRNSLRLLSFLTHTSLRTVLLLLLSLTLSAAAKSPSVRVPIFGFHDIIDTTDADKQMTRRPPVSTDYQKRNLYHFLNYLVVNDYWFLSSQDLFVYFIQKSKPIPPEYRGRKPVMITFDDGYSGVHENVLPILKDLEYIYREKVKIVVFVNPAYMGVNIPEYVPHMSCEDLRYGFKNGFYDIQSHGYSHQNLARLNAQTLQLELEKGKSKLRECTRDLDRNQLVGAHIAYPFGALTRRVERYLPGYHLTGYLYDDIVSRPALLKNPFRISRIPVNLRTTPRELVNLAETATPARF